MQMTSCPNCARHAPETRPTYPEPTITMRMFSAFHQALQQRPRFRRRVGAIERHADIGLQEADAAAAIIALTGVGHRMKWLVADHLGHGVGELDFPARALLVL